MKIMRFIGIVFALFSAGSPSDTSAQDSGKKYKVYMVSNSHLDTQWRWDVKATIDDYLYNTAVQNLALLEKYPHYVFNFEGAVKYEWIKEYYPHLFERIRKFVADGRWNISGASFEANDPNMPSSESFIRNILLAQEFYKKEFGIKSKDMFLPDCFGFSQVMPTLGHHCGLIGFSTQKLSWRTEPLVGDSKTPFPIGLWEGVDGARIMVALEPGRYSWNEFPEGDLSANEELAESARKSPFGIAYRYYGNKLANGAGDHGGSALQHPAARGGDYERQGARAACQRHVLAALRGLYALREPSGTPGVRRGDASRRPRSGLLYLPGRDEALQPP